VLEELEPRVLLSADVQAGLGDLGPEQETDPAEPAAQVALLDHAATSDQDAVRTRRELVIIDPGTDDVQQLVDDLQAATGADRQLEVVVLDPDRDGVAQIDEILADHENLDALHIVSHGREGGVRLGSTWLDADNLDVHASTIAGWSDALTLEADLLFYGCDLAGSDAGEAFVASLAKLTGADVAASVDVTGSALFGGDWDLEHRVGEIETSLAFSTDLQQSWAHALAIAVNQTNTGIAPSNASSDTVSHTTAGLNRLMLVGISFGEDKGDTVSSVTYNGTALTFVGAQDTSDTTKARVEIWSLVAPDTGTHNVVVSFSDTNHEGATIGVMTFTGADQLTPLGTFSSAEGSDAAPTTAVSSAADELVFGLAAFNDSSDYDFSPGGGQTERWDLYDNKTNGAGSTEAGAATVTTSWSLPTSGPWAAAGISIKPSTNITVIARETVDSDGDGQIDQIRIITSQALNDDFGDLTAVVTGYNVTGYSTGVANDNIFYVDLTESGTSDTGETPNVGITANTLLTTFSGSDSLAPESGQILFHSNRDGASEIYVMDADGTNVTRLTNSPGADRHATWSPDGSQIVFESERDGNREIYVMDADGSNQIRLTNDPAADRYADWSPDGSRIVFRSDRDGNSEIYVMDADGSNVTRLTNHAAADDLPAWSPDGSRIAFVSKRDGNSEIYVMDADGSNVTRLTSDAGTNEMPRWSPDGSQIAFVSRQGGNREIYVMDADGGNPINLTNDRAQDGAPSWGRLVSTATDAAAPVVSITRDDANPTSATSVTFSVDFSEDVTGIDASDFALDLTGTVAANATVTVGNAGDADDSTWTVTVDTITGTGTLGLDIAGASDITDLVGNAVDTTPTTDEVYTISNQPPTATNLSAPETYVEDTPLDLTDIVVSDIDSGNVTVTLTLSDATAGTLSTGVSGLVTSTFVGGVWTASGALADVNTLLAGVTFNPAVSYEADFTIATRVSDGVAPPVTGSKLMTATPVNDDPVVGDQTLGPVNENSPAGTVVGTVAASDVDAGQSLGFDIIGGNAAGTFAIDASSGEITVADPAVLDFETNPSFALTVEVTDDGLPSLTDTAIVTIGISNANDLPVFSDQSMSLTEFSLNGTVVGTIAASDQDVGDSLTFTILGGNTDGAFNLDPVTGKLAVADASALDSQTTPIFLLSVQVEDSTGATTSASLTVTVDPLGDPLIDEPGPDPIDPPIDPGIDPDVDPLPDPEDPEPDVPTTSDLTYQPLGAGVTIKPSRVPEADLDTAIWRRDEPREPEVSDSDDRPQGGDAESDVFQLRVMREQALWEALNVLGDEISDDADREQEKIEMTRSTVERVALALSTGVLALLARASSLAAMALSSLPVWRRVDPLTVLALSEREKRKREKELRNAELYEDDALGGLLAGEPKPERAAPEPDSDPDDEDVEDDLRV
jgi:Tol biopolymer transport system component